MNVGNVIEIRKACVRQKTQMWREFERIRPKLIEIAKGFYPNALDGLERAVEDVDTPHDREKDDDYYRLTLDPIDAFRIGTSGFFVNLTSPARRWYRLMARPRTFASGASDEGTAPIADSLTEASRYVIYRSGGYRCLNTAYKHLVAFGFAAMVVRPESDDEAMTRGRYAVAQCLPVGTYAMGIDSYGNVDRIVRHFGFNAEQLAEQFGRDNLPPNVVKALDDGSEKRFETWCLIEPHRRGFRRDAREFRLSYDDFTYRAVWWLASTEGSNCGILAVRGYRNCPIIAPRLEFELGSVYGRGRGTDLIGHVHGLQTACEDDLDISGQNAQPAVVASDELKEPGVNLGRGGINWVAPGEQKANAIYRALQEPADASGTRETMARLSQEIKRGMYNNEFASINMDDQNNPVRTATEVEYRKQQSLEQLSGSATTLDDQLLDPFVMAYVRITIDAGLVELPQDFDLRKMDVHYESNVHRAQIVTDINSRSASVGFASQIAQFQLKSGQTRTVLDNFELDKAVRAHHRALGAPEQDLKAPALVEQERDKRDEARRGAEDLAAKGQQAEIEKTASEAERNRVQAAAAGGGLGAVMAGVGGGY